MGRLGAKKEGVTYRPRSVSSLLMRLRAMVTCVGVCGVLVQRAGSGRGERVCVVEELKWAASRVSAFILI